LRDVPVLRLAGRPPGREASHRPRTHLDEDASRRTNDSYAFAFELLEKAGVGVAPGVDFGQAGKRAVRFSYASSEENIREAAMRLGEYLGKKK
jgi:aspartate/methionine/tyrosine aminotransferase